MKPRNEMEDRITSMTASAMFGEKGAEEQRIGGGGTDFGKQENMLPRTMGAGWLLYAFTRVVEPDIVLEVGAGGSSFCILEALRHNGKGHLHIICWWPPSSPCSLHLPKEDWMYAEDGSFVSMEQAFFFKGLRDEGFEDICTVHLGKSEDLAPKWNQPIDMLMVDSSHLEEDTRREVKLAELLPPGGYAFFHDFTVCSGSVGFPIQEFVDSHEDFAMIVEPDFLSMAILQRKFTFSADRSFFASQLLSVETNHQALTTPFQATASRDGGWCEPWQGVWLPDGQTWVKNQQLMIDAGVKFRESGVEQTIENAGKAIEEALKDGV